MKISMSLYIEFTEETGLRFKALKKTHQFL